MKPKKQNPILRTLAFTSLLSLAFTGSAHAASTSWVAAPTDSNWVTGANWASGTAPGTAAGGYTNSTRNNDVATFNQAIGGSGYGGTGSPVVIDANRFLKSITFDTGAGAYQIGTAGASNILYLDYLGAITVNAAVTSAQVINNPIRVRTPSSTNGTYTFQNNSTDVNATLSYGDTAFNLTSTNGSRPVVLILAGSNSGENIISSALTIPMGGQGASIITKNGTGKWILSGSNSFTINAGTTNSGIQINAGTLVARNANALGSVNSTSLANQISINNTGTLELGTGITLRDGLIINLNNGGTFASNGTNTSASTLSVATGASGTLTTLNSADVFTIGNGAGDIAGGDATSVINVTGLGTITPVSDNTYSGQWSINSGLLLLGSNQGFGNPANVQLGFGASTMGIVKLNGFNPTIGGLFSNITLGSPIVENGAATDSALTVSGVTTTTYAGLLQDGTGGGKLALSRSGTTGSLTLTNANTYTGGTTVNGGSLIINNTSGSATGTGDVAVNTNGTLKGTGTASGIVTVDNNGTIAPGNGVGTLSVSGLTLGTGAKLTYEFNASPANDYINVTNSGGLTIDAGAFTLYEEGTTNPLSTVGTYNLIGYSGAISGAGVSALSVANPASGRSYTFSATGSNVVLTVALSGTTGVWAVDASGSWNTAGNWTGGVPNAIGDTAKFTKALTAARTATLDGNKTIGGLEFDGGASPLGYTLAVGSGGTLTLQNTGSAPSVTTVKSGDNIISAPVDLVPATNSIEVVTDASLNISSVISGATAGISKTGAGLLNLTNASNTFGGNVSITGGTLAFTDHDSLGTGTDIVLDNATLKYNPSNTADISDKTITIAIGGGTIDTNGNTLSYANAIGNNGAGAFTKIGAGSLTLTGGSSYTGTTTLTEGTLDIAGSSASTGGTFLTGADTILSIVSDSSLGASPSVAATNLTFNPGNGNTATLKTTANATLSSTRNLAFLGDSATTVIMDTNGFNLSIAGSITGPSNLVKNSAGNLTLTGNAAAATGTTTINDGIIFVNSRANLPTGSITLNGTSGISNGSTGSNYDNVTVNGVNSLVKTGTGAILGLNNVYGDGKLTFGGSFVNDFTGSMAGFYGEIIANAGGFRWNGSTGSSSLTFDLASYGCSVRSNATSIYIGEIKGTATASLNGSGGGATQNMTYILGGKTVDVAGTPTPVNSTFPGTINNGTGTTGISVTGGSTITLSGINTYTGNTTVNSDSTLVLADTGKLNFKPTTNGVSNKVAGAAGVGTFTVDGDFTIDTSTANQTNNNEWILVDVASFATPPVFSATFSVDGFTEAADVWTKVDGANTWTFTEATGVLKLTRAGFAGWITGTFANGTVASGDQGPLADPDGDGLSNALEYAFDGNDPTVGNGSIGTISGNTVSFTKRALAVTNGDVTYAIEESTDLGQSDAWADVTPTVDNSTTISFDYTVGVRDFFRARATIAP